MTAVLAEFAIPDGDALVCTLCPFLCRLTPGQIGRCGVRRREGDRLVTETFATAAAHWHPVERKPLYHYHPGMSVLTLAAPGCTFTCGYCQNWRVSQVGRVPGAGAEVSHVDPGAVVAEAAARGGGISLSYAEPALAAELTLALAAHARPAGVPVMWKTNGFLTDAALDRLLPALDAVNVDLKAVDDASHRALTGAPLAPVLAAMARMAASGLWVEVSTPLLPGFNDDERWVRAMARSVAALGPEVPWHLLRFQPEFRWKDRDPTHPDALARAAVWARDEGLHHIYVERALGEVGRTTKCISCSAVVVTREIWAPGQSRLINGACPACGAAVAGRW